MLDLKKNFNKKREGFSLVELLLVLIVSSVIINLIYDSYFRLKENNIELTAIRNSKDIKNTLKDSLENNEILSGTLINQNNIVIINKDGNEIDIYNKNEWNNLIKNNDLDVELARIKFLNGIQPSKDKVFIYPMKNYIVNNLNKIPYIDYYILTVPRQLYKVYRETEAVTVNGITTPASSLKENLSELVEITETGMILHKYYENGNYNSTYYPKLIEKGITEKTFKKLRRGVLLTKVSTRSLILDKYLSSINEVNKITKSLKDWASIIQAERELKAVEGDSYNYDLFRGIGRDVDQGDIQFDRSLIFSSAGFNDYYSGALGLRNISVLDGVSYEGFNDIPVDSINSTDYGVIICDVKCQKEDLTNKLDNSNIITLRILEGVDTDEVYNDEGDEIDYNDLILYGNNNNHKMEVRYAIPIDSDYLFPGTKKILGIDNNDIHNSFGKNYKILLSNSEFINISNNSDDLRIDNLDNEAYTFKEKIPDKDKITYGPYGIVIFTIFPWSQYHTLNEDLNNDYNDDGNTDLEYNIHAEDGVYYQKVLPELR